MKTQAVNPFLPSYEYIPDAEPYVFGDRVYIYGSHDRFGGEDFCMNDYVCWSAPVDNLGEWRNEGVIYRAVWDPLNKNGQQHLFAPDVVVGKDGRYYLFYCLHMSPTVSVAVSDTPSGTFHFYGHIRYKNGELYGQKKGDVFNFDPGVLSDDNGKFYLYTGISHPKSAPLRKHLAGMFQIDGSYCTELEDDLLTLKTAPVLVVPGQLQAEGTDFEGHAFFEASSPRKINGKYYLIYSSEKSHDLCYAISDSPVKNFRYGGVIVSIGDIGIVDERHAVNYLGNTHGGLVQIRGCWYVFYHRHTNRCRNCRQMCAEKIQLQPDGRILQAEITSCGLNGGPLEGKGRYEARIACNLSSSQGTYMYQKTRVPGDETHPYFTQDGEDREDHPGQYIANLCDGAWAGFKYFSFKSSGRRIMSICTRGEGKGKFLVSTAPDGETVGKIQISPSKDWKTYSGEFLVNEGICALYFTYQGTESVDWKWFEIENEKEAKTWLL